MDINLLLRCGFSLAALVALWLALPRALLNRVGLVLLGIWAVGSGMLAFFPMTMPDDNVSTPRTFHALTVHGTIHVVLAVIAFFCCWCATLLPTIVLVRHWHGYPLLVTGLILGWIIATVGLVLMGSSGSPYGLDECLFLGGELLWIALGMVPLSWSNPHIFGTARRLAHHPAGRSL